MTDSDPFEIRIYDVAGDMYISMAQDKMRLSGTMFGDTANTCYIPVFRSPYASST